MLHPAQTVLVSPHWGCVMVKKKYIYIYLLASDPKLTVVNAKLPRISISFGSVHCSYSSQLLFCTAISSPETVLVLRMQQNPVAMRSRIITTITEQEMGTEQRTCLTKVTQKTHDRATSGNRKTLSPWVASKCLWVGSRHRASCQVQRGSAKHHVSCQ